jgi:hypothetical protein
MCKSYIKAFIALIMIISICFLFTISSFAARDTEIFFYDGTNIIQLTDNCFYDNSPQINNSGEVVWYGEVYGPLVNDAEIFYYNGTTITQLSDNGYWNRHPQISDSGKVVWQRFGYGYNSNIFYYDGTNITQLTNNRLHRLTTVER